MLRLAGGGVATVEAVRHYQAAPGETFTTYNLTVATYHTYFVSPTVDSPAIWVHNTNPIDRLVGCTKVTKSGAPGSGDLPELDPGYHYRHVGDQVQIVRNPGKATEGLPALHLENGEIVMGPRPGIARSTATRSAYPKQLDASKYPKWMRSDLAQGKVPVGFEVDHTKALFDNGADVITNMKLRPVDLHRIRHKFYRPGGKFPSINP